jgi:hypothetical protein
MTNWIHTAHNAITILKSISGDDAANGKMNRIIEEWENADKNRQDPKSLLTFFGAGLSIYTTLPENLKERLWVYVHSALKEASSIANTNKIRVTFDVTGARFD